MRARNVTIAGGAAPPPRIHEESTTVADSRPLVEQIQQISSKQIPASIQEINSRFAYVENVVNYCEAAYPDGAIRSIKKSR